MDIIVIKQNLKHFLYLIDKYKNSFFWTPSSTAAQRREKDFKFLLQFNIYEYDVHIECSYKESCKNCYFYKYIGVNNNKNDIRFVKKILKRIEKEIVTEEQELKNIFNIG